MIATAGSIRNREAAFDDLARGPGAQDNEAAGAPSTGSGIGKIGDCRTFECESSKTP
jgi:hypothetical protein